MPQISDRLPRYGVDYVMCVMVAIGTGKDQNAKLHALRIPLENKTKSTTDRPNQKPWSMFVHLHAKPAHTPHTHEAGQGTQRCRPCPWYVRPGVRYRAHP